jgi:hypothetical protein
MQMSGDGGTACAKARDYLPNPVQGVGGAPARLSLLRITNQPSIVGARLRSEQMSGALDRIQPSHTPADWRAAAAMGDGTGQNVVLRTFHGRSPFSGEPAETSYLARVSDRVAEHLRDARERDMLGIWSTRTGYQGIDTDGQTIPAAQAVAPALGALDECRALAGLTSRPERVAEA